MIVNDQTVSFIETVEHHGMGIIALQPAIKDRQA